MVTFSIPSFGKETLSPARHRPVATSRLSPADQSCGCAAPVAT
jgi:hypothetical protein